MIDEDAHLRAELLSLTRPTSDVAAARPTRIVVLAGGRGRRLEPYTSVLPKPLMPIGNRSILEILVHQLSAAGFCNFTFCVGYLSHLIRAVFDNGVSKHIDIDWVQEQEPLGTAAPLRLVDGLDETFLSMNGDLLTTLDFGALLEHHRASANAITIATHQRLVPSDYGVLHFDEAPGSLRVVAYEEKPQAVWNVSMGVYALEPSVLELIPTEGAFDFPDLVHAALERDIRVGAFMHDGLWLDIGRHEDYERANELWEHGARLSAEESGD